jgi:hypothetical protein
MMEIYANRRDEVQKLFKAKEQFHRERARLPFEEKIKILVELQKLAIDIPTASKEKRFKRVWEI